MSTAVHPVLERLAKAIARANGDEFANAFASKARWVAKRGMSGGRYRDIAEPFQHDYLDMARAAVQALMEPDEGMVEAGEQAAWDSHNSMPAPRAIQAAFQAMLQTLI